jgi:hypothetical protein
VQDLLIASLGNSEPPNFPPPRSRHSWRKGRAAGGLAEDEADQNDRWCLVTHVPKTNRGAPKPQRIHSTAEAEALDDAGARAGNPLTSATP